MATAKRNYIDNNITFKSGNTTTKVTQRIHTLKKSLINFATDKEAKNAIFSIEKDDKGQIYLHFNKPELLLDSEGNKLNIDQDIVLDPATYSLNIMPVKTGAVGQEIEVTVKDKVGKIFTLKANATSVVLNQEGKEYAHKIDPKANQTLTMGISNEAVEMYMGSNSNENAFKLFEHPESIVDSFPLPILLMYLSRQDKSTQKIKLGSYEIYMLDFAQTGKIPEIIIKDTTGKGQNYFLAKGSLLPITSYTALFDENKKEKQSSYSIALQCGEKEFQLNIANEGQTITNGALEAVNLFSELNITQNKKEYKTKAIEKTNIREVSLAPTENETETESKNVLSFYRKDPRQKGITNEFHIKKANYVVEENVEREKPRQPEQPRRLVDLDEIKQQPVINIINQTITILTQVINGATDIQKEDLLKLIEVLRSIDEALKGLEGETDVSKITELLDNINNNLQSIKEILERLEQSGLDAETLKTIKALLEEINKKLDGIIKEKQPEKETEIDPGPDTELEPEDDKEKDKKKDDEKKKDEPEKPKVKNVKGKAIAEGVSMAIGIFGFLLVAGYALTGFAPLLFFAVTAVATSVAGTILADKFNYKKYEDAHKVLTRKEFEEQQDAEAIEDFLANEKVLDASKEDVQKFAREFSDNFDEKSPLHKLGEFYNKYGVGFNSENLNEENTRLDRLSSIDGHKLREGMLEGIDSINEQGITEEEKRKRVSAFVDKYFDPKFPDASINNKNFETAKTTYENERKEIEKLLLSNDPMAIQAITGLRDSMRTLNNEENTYFETYNNQKRSVGGMTDVMIARLATSKEMNAEQRVEFFKRYGATIYRHFALDKNVNQHKLEKLFEGLSEEEQSQCIEIMKETGKRMGSKLEGLEGIAKSNREKLKTAEIQTNYIDSMNTLANTQEEYASDVELTAISMKYTALQTYKLNSNALKYSQSSQVISACKPTETEKYANNINNLITVACAEPKVSKSKGNPYTERFKSILQEAQKLGILHEIALEYAGGSQSAPTVSTKGIRSDEKLLNLIKSTVNAKKFSENYNETRYKTINDLLDQVEPNNDRVKRTNAVVDKIFDTIKDKDKIRNSADFQAQFKAIKGDLAKESVSTDNNLCHGMSEDQIKRYLVVKIYLSQCARSKDKDLKSYAEKASSILELAIKGTITNDFLLNAENQAIGEMYNITAETNLDEEISNSSGETAAKIKGYRNLEAIVNKFPEPAKLKNQIRDAIRVALKKDPNTNTKDVIISVIKNQYGNVKIEATGKTCAEIIDECTTDGVCDWDKATGYVNGVKSNITNHGEYEASCVANDLGTEFSKTLYEKLVSGGEYDQSNLITPTPEILKEEQDDEKEIDSLTETQDSFLTAWRKALSGSFVDLVGLFKAPAQSTGITNSQKRENKKQSDDYTNFINNFKKLYSENILKQIQDFISQVEKLPEEGKEDAVKKLAMQLKFIEMDNNLSFMGVEKINSLRTMLYKKKALNRAQDNDKELVEHNFEEGSLISDADNFTTKYEAILKLKDKGYTPTQISEVLRDFATGNLRKLNSIKALKGLHFTLEDQERFKRLGLTTEIITAKDASVVTDHLTKKLDEKKKKRNELESKGADKREDKRTEDLTHLSNVGGVKNLIGLVGILFENTDAKIKTERERKRLEEERLGKIMEEQQLETDGVEIDTTTQADAS